VTDSNYSHITIVADRSGSMQAIRSDAEGAINAFIKDQQKAEGRATLTLVDFDTQEPYNVVFDGKLEDAPKYNLNPRGGTPLRDAIGRGITQTGEMLAALEEDKRPGHVFFVVQTDGQENSSKEWTQEAINAAIKDHEDNFAWTFVFLASGPQAWSAAQAFVGTNMHSNNVVLNTGGGHSHSHSMNYVASNIAATRGGQHVHSYAASVDDEGAVAKRDEEAESK
jgi:Mg-chelatase subunit ChlD